MSDIGPFNCPECGRFSRDSWADWSAPIYIWGGTCNVHGEWRDNT